MAGRDNQWLLIIEQNFRKRSWTTAATRSQDQKFSRVDDGNNEFVM